MKKLISQATQKNWERLKVNKKDKLTSRANKRKSTKQIIPLEYISHKENIPKIMKLLDFVKGKNWKTEDIIYSLAINQINTNAIANQKNVKNFLEEYSKWKKISQLVTYKELPKKENDFLGLFYQCLLMEGEKNRKGSYYTPKKITEKMTQDLDFSNSQTFLDPCCGSGAFLLALNVKNPKQIYGIDTDKIAVMIAKINLIIKYKGIEFEPNIYQENFLARKNQVGPKSSELNRTFTYIVTNPPWGAVTKGSYIPSFITSKEVFSCFLVKAFTCLEENGKIRFLLPISILNVKSHQDIRDYILKHGNLSKITFYQDTFTGVVTKYIDLELEKKQAREDVIIEDGNKRHIEKKEQFTSTQHHTFTIMNDQNREIIQKIKENGKYYLTNSIWALGIVTGDNQNKLRNEPTKGYEAIYTGKEIKPYLLEKPKKYVKYDRTSFQQVAKDEYYRAKEKLVYKFISKKLVFAYDNQRRLVLNSANLLIPNIPNMSIKTVMAYLNSELFSYYYKKLFGEIKILKGNLMEIPFPAITKEEDRKITAMVNKRMKGKDNEEAIQKEIYKTYNLNAFEIEVIKGELK